MDKRYQHQQVETEVYKLWEKSGAFNPDKLNPTTRKSFCIIMPPPNANDPLHLGHATYAIQDVLIRYHRMKGDDTLYLPATDHAGIETQFVFEKKLKKHGQSRFDYDRQTLYQLIWDYVQENSGIATKQLKKIGMSADWSRQKFTLDEDIIKLVLETFKNLYQDGLIYRDIKLVNYSPKAGTAYSDLEVKHESRKTKLYYLKYGPFTVATTRPETIFGDTAIAVNPLDKRYQKYIGQRVEVNQLIRKIKLPVIADDEVDPEFGTGALKITPYHDHHDFEIWQRHKEEMPQPQQVIDFSGRLNELTGKYEGLTVHTGRIKISEDLQAAGLIEKVDNNYEHQASLCYKTNGQIEPLPLPQFFIKVRPLVKKSLEVIKQNKIKIHGSGHDKILLHWLENLKDWNISRQIVWGIRLPIWYSAKENPKLQLTFINKNQELKKGILEELLAQGHSLLEIKKGLQELKAPLTAKFELSQTSPGDNFLQETDTFDTWFSSGQWPVVTLKTSGKNDFERFYPTSVMDTAYDILPFWVMRMIMLGLYSTGKIPFKEVYFHGLIRDSKGQKMSKSKGNVINPLEVVEEYSADALRLALIIRSSAGLDKSVNPADFKAARNFCNKLWNASRFLLLDQVGLIQDEPKKLDKNFIKHLNNLVSESTKHLEELKLGLLADRLYDEFWHWFCDECLENSKQGFISKKILAQGLITFLKLLHPIIPFVTEKIWQELQTTSLKNQLDSPLLLTASWPKEL